MNPETDDFAFGMVVGDASERPEFGGEDEMVAAAALAAEVEREARIKKLMAMRALVQRLSTERDEFIRIKRPIDTMNLDSLRLYRGEDCYEDATKAQPVNSDNTTRPPRTKILRSLTDKWEARMVEMLSANPWGIEPDCDPDELKANPEWAAKLQVACDGMEKTIRNQLEWCKFDRSIRNMCKDAARIGTGLLTGPRNAVRRKRTYGPAPQNDWQQHGFVPSKGGESKMTVEESLVPEFDQADPFLFFPDMTERAEKAEKAYYAHLLSRTEVKNLAPGFDEFQVNALLRTEPDLGELRRSLALRMTYLNQSDIYKDRYAVWRYTGILSREDLETLDLCGCEDEGDDLGSAEPPEMAMADIWFCQDFILRSKLAPVPDDYRVPYYVFAPFPLDGSMFGMGLPMMGVDSSRVANAAWLMALHSQSVSSGQQIVMNKGKIVPADQQWSVRGPKVWYTKDDAAPDAVFSAFTVPNESEGALNIFDRAIALLYEELNASQWADKEGAAEQETASGLAMVLNVQSILQGRVASTADDDIFEPIICRALWWNNDFGKDESIKGNYKPRPLVQSERLVKDVKAQQMGAFTAMLADPRFEGMADNRKLLEANIAQLDGQYAEILLPQTVYEQNMQNKPPDPAMLQQQFLTIRAQTEQLKAQRETVLAETDKIKQQMAFLELQAAQNPQTDNSGAMSELAVKAEGLQFQRTKLAADIQMAQASEETKRLDIAERSRQQDLEAQEFAYEKQQDRKVGLLKEGMKTEREVQELNYKRETGKPGI